MASVAWIRSILLVLAVTSTVCLRSAFAGTLQLTLGRVEWTSCALALCPTAHRCHGHALYHWTPLGGYSHDGSIRFDLSDRCVLIDSALSVWGMSQAYHYMLYLAWHAMYAPCPGRTPIFTVADKSSDYAFRQRILR
ncbi:hypothetical protein BD414DRAFT_503435 [Trametes punicea]|nr:hypothetical protein BD414DRAFT_503435 [Trametes punicea]